LQSYDPAMTDGQSSKILKQMRTNAGQTQAKANGESRRERQKAETRRSLYRAALRLFAKRGLAATTVEDITKAAGVAKGTFFFHFPAKEEVFTVFIESQLANVAKAAQDAPNAPSSTKELLRRLFYRNAQEFGRNATLTRALLSSVFLNEAARQIMSQGMTSGRQGLARIIVLGQKRGDIRAECNPERVALAFQQALLGTVLVWAVQTKGKLSSRLDASFNEFWSGVAGTEN
jgi:AcrR family transcriptional regulator